MHAVIKTERTGLERWCISCRLGKFKIVSYMLKQLLQKTRQAGLTLFYAKDFAHKSQLKDSMGGTDQDQDDITPDLEAVGWQRKIL